MMKESLGHGTHALGLAIHSLVTCMLVVYVLLMRVLLKTMVPCVARTWRGESSPNSIIERLLGFIIHAGFIIGALALIPAPLLGFENMETVSKVKSLLYFALILSFMESIFFHTTYEICHCRMKGMKTGPTMAAVTRAFLSNLVHFPVVIIELMILLTMFGHGFFNQTHEDLANVNPFIIWAILLLLVFFTIQIRVLKLKKPNKLTIDVECDIQNGYGSMEDVCLLPGHVINKGTQSSNSENRSFSDEYSHTTFLNWNACRDYFARLRLASDILVLSLVIVLIKNFTPLLGVLQPLAKTSMGMMTAWVSVPLLVVALLVLMMIIHFLFVH